MKKIIVSEKNYSYMLFPIFSVNSQNSQNACGFGSLLILLEIGSKSGL